jgi:hypothetical protein
MLPLARLRALLISHSGRPYLAHARAELLDFLGPARRLGFVTTASLRDEEAYYETARGALAPEIVLARGAGRRQRPGRWGPSAGRQEG